MAFKKKDQPSAQGHVKLEIPRFFRWRSYQAEFIRAMRGGCRRAALVWHRRAGKDAAVLNWTIEAMLQRAGSYYYFFPTLKLGRRILWKGLQADGMPFLNHFPRELIIGEPNETEMSVKLARPDSLGGGHSIFQVLGAKEIDESAIGTNPVGTVWSEFSLAHMNHAWDLVRPILAENLGWAVFPFTPRGKNHGHKLWVLANENRGEWFTSLRTVEQTVRDGENEGLRAGQPVVSLDVVDAERRAGMAEELIQQEFYCSFEGSILGSYFGDAIERMEREGRIRDGGSSGLWDRETLVDTAWDLGADDETVIGFWQTVEYRTGRQWLYLVDVHAERRNEGGIADYWRFLRNDKPYTYGQHEAPWDIKVQEWGSGSTRLQSASRLGLNFNVGKKLSIADGIQAVRRMLPNLIVDGPRCQQWLTAMKEYHREFDEERMTFLDKPVHDGSSHYADMTRVKAVAYAHPAARFESRETLPDRAETERDLFENDRSEYNALADRWDRGGTNWSIFDR